MAMKKEVSLYQAATSGGRVAKQGPLVQFILDGNGAMVTSTMDWAMAEKWANSKSSTGIRATDRNRFLDQIPTLAARPGSFIGTRGSTKPLTDLCILMKNNGYDLKEWALPPELKDLGDPTKKKEEKRYVPPPDDPPAAGAETKKPA